VKNADAFLIKTPQNKYFMVDTGKSGYNGGKSQADFIILKYMRDRGIKTLDGLILTHFDNDHSGGAEDIMKNIKVNKVYLNSYADKSKTSAGIYETIKECGIPAAIVQNDSMIYEEKDLKIKAFGKMSANVPTQKKQGHSADNENSIITLVSYKDFDMLFMGDAGVEGFNGVRRNLPHNIEVLKVGHHGGRHVADAKMLEHLGNKVSLISTGTNTYGHPNKGTLDVLRKTDIYRTDRHHSVKVTSDGNTYSVFTFDKDKRKYIEAKNY
jgi:competence protein ComEC